MSNQHGYHCPKCNSDDDLSIEVKHMVSLYADGTDCEGGDSEWGDDSFTQCAGCGWEGKVGDLIVVEEAEGDEEDEEYDDDD